MPMGGNPWANAAGAYGQDLDQLGQIQQQGMQQQAQAPLSLYDRFMDGYEKARARAMQEQQMQMQQANQQRQMMLAESKLQHDRETESFNRDRLTTMDQRDATKEAMDALSSYNARVPGLDSPVKALFKRAGLGDPSLPSVEGGAGGEALPGPIRPGEEPLVRQQWEDELSGYGPAAREKRTGQIRLERKDETDALDRAERLSVMSEEKQKDRDLRREIADQSAADRAEARAERRESKAQRDFDKQKDVNDKALAGRRGDEAVIYGVEDSLEKLKRGVQEIKDHPGFEAAIGKSAVMGKIPTTKAYGAANKIDVLKNQLWKEAIGSLRNPKTGATGLGAITEKENARIEGLVAKLDPFMDPTDFKKSLDEIVRFADETKSKARKMLEIKYGRTQEPNSSGPQKGDIEDGFVFLGGDPKDKKNWKEVK
jgi:KaiC/GvpD/RAD55 family RecA-like ATPase